MNAEQIENINELCEVYHRLDCDRETDAVVITLLLSLLGYAPVADTPQTVKGSINAFRLVGYQERYNFTMTAVATLLEIPSKNIFIRKAFNRVTRNVDPLKDVTGRTVIESVKFNFGPYKMSHVGRWFFCV